MPCCPTEEERKQHVKAMTHDERLVFAQQRRSRAMAMLGAGGGILGGLTAGLWSSIGAGALGVGIGASVGLFVNSRRFFREARETLTWDHEFQQENEEDPEKEEP
eukprot:CAMPEP_0178753616 /NCGR_PEP_ID=MMETSP0744-20121128/11705_1 /TAXON_ID=913974 /ORGANISM="Nitzschia punctata, Strain CCMP561" /LENGTH=104 /DNA_ID=CAMNT_0020407441 /DNA_START=13 /DNA_END=327 /DNA_ORIENTATION=-